MDHGLFATIFGDAAKSEVGAESFYECTACGSTFGEWTAACPDCGQLVVRIVEPRSTERV